MISKNRKIIAKSKRTQATLENQTQKPNRLGQNQVEIKDTTHP